LFFCFSSGCVSSSQSLSLTTHTISTLRACQFRFNRKQTNVEHRQNFLGFSKTLSVFWCHGECAKQWKAIETSEKLRKITQNNETANNRYTATLGKALVHCTVAIWQLTWNEHCSMPLFGQVAIISYSREQIRPAERGYRPSYAADENLWVPLNHRSLSMQSKYFYNKQDSFFQFIAGPKSNWCSSASQ